MLNNARGVRRLMLALLAVMALFAVSCGEDLSDDLAAAQRAAADAEAALASAQDDAAEARADAAAAAAAVVPDLGQINFALEWVASGYHAPFYLAEAHDLWGKRGLRVNIREGAGSGGAVDAVAGGANDIAIADRGVIAVKASGGAEVVSAFGLVNKGALTVSCRADSGIGSVAELPGATILTTLAGSDGTLLPAFLNGAGVDPSSVTIEGTNAPGKTSLLVAGQGDCSTFVSYVQPVLVSYGTDGTDGVELNNFMWADNGLNILGNGLVVRSEWAAANADALAAFLAGVQEAYQMTLDDPSVAVAAWSANFPRENADLAQRQLVASLESVFSANTEGEQIGYQSEDDWSNTVDALAGGGLIEAPMDASAYFTNDFLGG